MKVTEVHVDEKGLRHVLLFTDRFSVHDTDAEIVYLEADREEVEAFVGLQNPAIEIKGEHEV